MFVELLIEFIITGVSSFALTAILSHYIIPILVAKKAGQPIRREGPKSHFSKQGTPTMGGIMFIIAVFVSFICGMILCHALGGVFQQVHITNNGGQGRFDIVGHIGDQLRFHPLRAQLLLCRLGILPEGGVLCLLLLVLEVYSSLSDVKDTSPTNPVVL